MSFLRTQESRDAKSGIRSGIMKPYYVNIVASKRNGTLYIGVTNDLTRRILEQKNGQIPGFSQRYKTHLLVYYEIFNDPDNAIKREKQLKRWKRFWKLKLIEQINPEWNDLFEEINFSGSLRSQG